MTLHVRKSLLTLTDDRLWPWALEYEWRHDCGLHLIESSFAVPKWALSAFNGTNTFFFLLHSDGDYYPTYLTLCFTRILNLLRAAQRATAIILIWLLLLQLLLIVVVIFIWLLLLQLIHGCTQHLMLGFMWYSGLMVSRVLSKPKALSCSS